VTAFIILRLAFAIIQRNKSKNSKHEHPKANAIGIRKPPPIEIYIDDAFTHCAERKAEYKFPETEPKSRIM
jgi:hypothetical protein